MSLNLLQDKLLRQMLHLYGTEELHTDILITVMMQAMQAQHLILLAQEFVMDQALVMLISHKQQ